ncbi:DUF4192 domain-containing protein [Kineococcus esterisolvens]|uniref:DUF4192 domain-containing protein n=1 Tax=unclassified Kineococcus TaxID=2621656 RepID=UPI003D7CA0F0
MTTDTAHQPPLVLSGPAELLAALPYRLGFHPHHSLVLLELETGPPTPAGDRARLGAVVRVDLPGPAAPGAPAPGDPAELERLAAGAAAEAVACLVRTRAGVGGRGHPVVLACYDETGTAPGAQLRAGPAGAAAVAAALSGLRTAGLEPGEAVLVAGGRWRCLTCPGEHCCPPAGLALHGPAADRVAAEAVGRGLSALADRDAVLPDRSPLPRERREAARAARRATAARGPWTEGRRARALAEFSHQVRRYLPPGAPRLPDPGAAGHLLAALEDVPVRDAALLTGAPGQLRVPAVAALLRTPPGTVDAAAAALVHRALAAEPDRSRSVATAALAVDLARHAPGPLGAGAWALAGWAYWSVGDGVRAGACTEAALEADPGHRLAGLVASALRAGLPPRERGAR